MADPKSDSEKLLSSPSLLTSESKPFFHLEDVPCLHPCENATASQRYLTTRWIVAGDKERGLQSSFRYSSGTIVQQSNRHPQRPIEQASNGTQSLVGNVKAPGRGHVRPMSDISTRTDFRTRASLLDTLPESHRAEILQNSKQNVGSGGSQA